MSINKDSQKAPNLRFKGFTDDWEQRKLENLVTRVKSYSLSRSVETNSDTNTKYIHYGDIHTHVADKIEKDTKLPNIIPGDYETLNKGDLVLADASEDYQGIATPAIVMTQTDYSLVAGLHTIALRPIKIDSLYLYYLIKSSTFRKYGYKVGTGMKVFGISVNRLLEFKAFMPITEEQSKIAELLLLMDKSITLHQRKLDQLNQLKQALLQQMFPGKGETVPKLRFAGFEGDWEERKLGDTLVELKSGLSRMLSNNDIGLPVIRANNIKNGMLNLEADIKYWYSDDPQGANTENYLVEKEDILINFINSDTKMGTAAIVREAISRNTIYTTNILKAQTNSDFNSYFWFTLTQTLQYKNSIKMITKPAVNQSSFTTVDFKKLIFVFPKLSEQSKIGKLFKELDNYIVLQSQKVNKLKLMKELLLQNMFI